MFSNLPPGVLVFAVVLVLSLMALAYLFYSVTLGPRARLQRRIAAVAGAPQALQRAPRGRALKALSAAGGRRKNIHSKLKGMDEKRAGSGKGKLRENLEQAGLSWSVRTFVIVSIVLGALGGGLYLASGLPWIGVIFVALISGLGLPRLFVNHRRKRRLDRFTALLPDAIDLIVRGVRSGLPVAECITIIGNEMPDPVGSEFRLVAESQKLAVTIEEALNRATRRTPTPEFRFFTIVLQIQHQTGGNLAETLSKLSDVLRQRKKMRDKIQAMSMEAKASAGIIGSLPIVVGTVLYFIQPDYIALLFTTDAGNKILFAAGFVMGIGVLVMRQMINFDF